MVSLASFAWTLYKDLRRNEPTAVDSILKDMLLKRLRQEAAPPSALPEPLRERLHEAAAEEALEEARRTAER